MVCAACEHEHLQVFELGQFRIDRYGYIAVVMISLMPIRLTDRRALSMSALPAFAGCPLQHDRYRCQHPQRHPSVRRPLRLMRLSPLPELTKLPVFIGATTHESAIDSQEE